MLPEKIEKISEEQSTLSSKIRDTVVYGGGIVSAYVLSPAVTYMATPVTEYVAPVAVSAAGSVITAMSLSPPVAFGMVIAAGYGIPRIISYSASSLHQGTRAIGEAATSAVINGTSTAITYAYGAARNKLSNMWFGSSKQQDEEFELDPEMETMVNKQTP